MAYSRCGLRRSAAALRPQLITQQAPAAPASPIARANGTVVDNFVSPVAIGQTCYRPLALAARAQQRDDGCVARPEEAEDLIGEDVDADDIFARVPA